MGYSSLTPLLPLHLPRVRRVGSRPLVPKPDIRVDMWTSKPARGVVPIPLVLRGHHSSVTCVSMSATCCNHPDDPHRGDQGYRRVLWAVLAINAVMFAIEVAAGVAAGSASLQADALDFL